MAPSTGPFLPKTTCLASLPGLPAIVPICVPQSFSSSRSLVLQGAAVRTPVTPPPGPRFGVPSAPPSGPLYWIPSSPPSGSHIRTPSHLPQGSTDGIPSSPLRRPIASPLPAAFNRVIQIGDASGIQSPVSFGGFGSMTRHLKRLSTGLHEAVSGNFLDARSLSLLNPYMPNLRASWLFQRAMSAKHSGVSPTFINDLLHVNFLSMQKLGNPVLRPFLQDVIQFGPLAKTLGLVMLTQPGILPSILSQVGVGAILDWSVHFFMLGLYTLLSKFVDPWIRPWVEELPKKERFVWRRQLDAWKYGSGLDYEI